MCSNMDGPRDYCIKWSKPDSERQISYDIVYMFIYDYMWSLKEKNDTNELTSKAEAHRHRKETYGYQKGKGVGDG